MPANIENQQKIETSKESRLSPKEFLAASLCANCAHLDGCGLFAEAPSPVLQCELYFCCALPRPEIVGGGHEGEAPPEPRRETLHLLGLCANCELRSECRLPKPQSGVWHCEEYR